MISIPPNADGTRFVRALGHPVAIAQAGAGSAEEA